jgi:hypothetical protein
MLGLSSCQSLLKALLHVCKHARQGRGCPALLLLLLLLLGRPCAAAWKWMLDVYTLANTVLS